MKCGSTVTGLRKNMQKSPISGPLEIACSVLNALEQQSFAVISNRNSSPSLGRSDKQAIKYVASKGLMLKPRSFMHYVVVGPFFP